MFTVWDLLEISSEDLVHLRRQWTGAALICRTCAQHIANWQLRQMCLASEHLPQEVAVCNQVQCNQCQCQRQQVLSSAMFASQHCD